MESITTKRGYDDTGYLKQMAAGLVVRTWGSVDEAAKAVLGEEAGSNVDRLRRKFREQSWYERGLSEHVEREIARRGLSSPPAWLSVTSTAASAFLSPFATLTTFVRKLDNVLRSARPGGGATFASLAATLMMVAAASGTLSMSLAVTTLVSVSVLLLIVWADRTSTTAAVNPAKACWHMGGLAFLMVFVVVFFAVLDPTAAYTLGSSQGAMAASAGMTALGTYATGFVGARTRGDGTRSRMEIRCVIAALATISQIGTLLMIHDILAL